MWDHPDLRGKFRSQVQLGPYRVDFFFQSGALIVEADGALYHSSIAARLRDWGRDRYAAGNGMRTLRMKNDEIIHSVNMCAARVAQVLKEL